MGGAFRERLERLRRSSEDRRWLFVPYDQLSDGIGPLSREDPSELGIVLVENAWKAALRPYHRQKLALVLTSMRHFALEQAERGVAVEYVSADAPYAQALRPLARELGPLRVMLPAERELRVDLASLIDEGALEVVPHEGWLSTQEDFDELGDPPWRMDAFYRRVRKRTGILMDEEGKPLGGKLSFDVENRKAWKGEPPAPEPPSFEPDEITREVGRLIEERFARHPGRLDLEQLPATRSDVEALWKWVREQCLPSFGPYEDAMSRSSRSLFHTRISSLLNLHRLLPERVVREAMELDLPLASVEGFVRQILGWREFVRHVHAATDGFRQLAGRRTGVDETPGNGGWSGWSGEAWPVPAGEGAPEGGARPSLLRARAALPPAWWGETSGLECLDRIVAEVWETAYTHHVPRLMVLGNLATLLGIAPRELCDWFWVAFFDAYDWVVEPNVLGMATFAAGDLMTTKPYVCGAAYIDRMSDYCGACRFDPRKDCPITPLYWAFLERNRERLAENPRLAMPLRSVAKRSSRKKDHDRRVRERVRRRLSNGEEVTADDVE